MANLAVRISVNDFTAHYADRSTKCHEMLDYFEVEDVTNSAFMKLQRSARSKYPTRLSHTIRIGHRAALHLGVLQQRRPSMGSEPGPRV